VINRLSIISGEGYYQVPTNVIDNHPLGCGFWFDNTGIAIKYNMYD